MAAAMAGAGAVPGQRARPVESGIVFRTADDLAKLEDERKSMVSHTCETGWDECCVFTVESFAEEEEQRRVAGEAARQEMLQRAAALGITSGKVRIAPVDEGYMHSHLLS